MKLRSIAATGLLLATGTTAFASDGWYAESQAKQGHLLFNNYCAECHRPDLTGAMGPPLKGKSFKDRWNGKSVEDLFTFEHTNMPEVNPGSMSKDQILLITAYILSKNDFPAGNTPLSESMAKTLTIKAN